MLPEIAAVVEGIDSRQTFHPASPIIKLLSWNTTKKNYNSGVKISETIVLNGLRVWEFGLGFNDPGISWADQ